MSDLAIQQVLTQMRALQSAGGMESASNVQQGPNFAEMLGQSINRVNEAQQNAGELRTAFEQGDPMVSLTEVMIASQKARVSFEAMAEVRNRLVEAYQEIQRMSI